MVSRAMSHHAEARRICKLPDRQTRNCLELPNKYLPVGSSSTVEKRIEQAEPSPSQPSHQDWDYRPRIVAAWSQRMAESEPPDFDDLTYVKRVLDKETNLSYRRADLKHTLAPGSCPSRYLLTYDPRNLRT